MTPPKSKRRGASERKNRRLGARNSTGACPWCGQESWVDRKAAREAARLTTGTVDYACPRAPDYVDRPPWHVGPP